MIQSLRNKWKKLLCLTLTAMVLGGLSITALAADDIPDPSRTGSISLTMTYQGRAVSGGNLIAYKVANLEKVGSGFEYNWVDALQSAGLSMDDLGKASLASQTEKAVLSAGLSQAASTTLGSDGKASMSGLSTGVYLIRQTKRSSGYELIKPFLVTVPMVSGGKYVYNVDASPKPEVIKRTSPDRDERTPTTSPSETTAPGTTSPGGGGDNPETPETGPDGRVLGASRGAGDEPVGQVLGASRLPQTGQLNWPVAVMACLGAVLVMSGVMLRRADSLAN